MNDIDFKKVKVGDIVCDCRNKHLKVIEAEPFYGDKPDGPVWDYDLVLEDNSRCSAKNCCDVVPHDWKDDPDCERHPEE